MQYSDIHAWTKMFGLVENRVKVINDTVPTDYGIVSKLSYNCGKYEVEICGCLFCSFGVYDLESIDSAFSRLDAFSDGLWYMSRFGLFTKNQQTMGNWSLCKA